MVFLHDVLFDTNTPCENAGACPLPPNFILAPLIVLLVAPSVVPFD
ncbi:MAG: hypothetical protein R3A12_17750 [Ignavibacteria bacterium]